MFYTYVTTNYLAVLFHVKKFKLQYFITNEHMSGTYLDSENSN